MRRIGQIIGSVVGLGVGLLLLFAPAGKAADDVTGLAAYTWTVSWDAGTSTWCFNQTADGFYQGDEFGVGNAHANSVTYDAGTHVLAMEATSNDGSHVAQYTWTMSVDESNLVTANDLAGTIVFSQPTPLTQTITITRGERRPASPCDQPGAPTDNGGGNEGAAAGAQTAQNGAGGDNGGVDQPASGPDDGMPAQNQSGGGQQAGNQGGGRPPATALGGLLGVGGGGGDAPVWCVMRRTGPNGNAEETVIRCNDMAGAGPGWLPVASNLTFVAASEMRDSFNAGNEAAVWCVMRRTGPNGNAEETVIRCSDMAGAGPGWLPVASNLTFVAASAMRDSFNAGNEAAVWCVMRRTGPDGNAEETVVRCDQVAGAGPGWLPVASNLTFTAASAMRDDFNASNPPAVWCVMRRTGPDGEAEETVIRCDQMAGAGAGWTLVASNLTFGAASAMRDDFDAGE